MLSAAEQQQALRALSTLTKRDLAAIWAKLNLGKPEALAEPLAVILEEITAKYGSAAATLAADWYDEARDSARAAGSFRAAPAVLPDPSRFESLARWGVGPMFGGEGAPTALSLLLGGLSRQVLNMARDTTAQSVADDPARPRFARHASANACAFCALMATRGAVYASKTTAGMADKYHDDCHCTTVPVFPGQQYDEAPYVAKWREAYSDTSSGKTDVVLAEMRKSLGTN